MRKLAIAMLLLLPTAVLSGAQAQPAMKLSGTMEDIPLSEMIQLTSEYEKMRFLYNPRAVGGDVTIAAPKEGFSVSPGELHLVLQETLSQFRLTILESGPTWVIVPTADACTHAPVLMEHELEGYNESLWVTVLVMLDHASPNTVRGCLQYFANRQGGSVQTGPGCLLICDRCDRVREMLKIVHEIDDASKLSTIRYELPAGSDAQAWAEALFALIPHRPDLACRVTAVPKSEALMVTANEATHADIPAALEVLK